jgi:hypothetical protein
MRVYSQYGSFTGVQDASESQTALYAAFQAHSSVAGMAGKCL